MEKATLVVCISSFLEQKLKNDWRAKGAGLCELAKSAQDMDSQLSKTLCALAKKRNKTVHDEDADLDEEDFLKQALKIAFQLGQDKAKKKSNASPMAPKAPADAPPAIVAPDPLFTLGGFRPLMSEIRNTEQAISSRESHQDRVGMAHEFTSEEIIDLLNTAYPTLSEDDFKRQCDAAFAKAKHAPYKLPAATNAFIYLAKQPNADADYRFANLALALRANGSIFEIPVLVRQIIPKEYLASRWLEALDRS